MVKKSGSSKPPNTPWKPLEDKTGAGYLSVYLSDPVARYPVRYVTKPRDNKSDPNLETGTYGLFSTCEFDLRGKAVRDGRTHIFFVTSHGKEKRALTGYYDIGWFAESTAGAGRGDYALAARELRFVDPILLSDLPSSVRDVCAPFFRLMRPIDTVTTKALRKIIDRRPDRTADYVDEIHRLEHLSHFKTGYTYPTWGKDDTFEWGHAAAYLGKLGTVYKGTNPGGLWRCTSCGYRDIRSKAPLKQCPLCKEMGTLQPQ
ncbi:hypothetical protein GCM10009554_38970 [Kribbella koreensis]|uniref:Uncharacterized protein n=1 Tax=Kribbella koreensis TaxID=57909 RepID=A0ABN1QMS3_9ACTN